MRKDGGDATLHSKNALQQFVVAGRLHFHQNLFFTSLRAKKQDSPIRNNKRLSYVYQSVSPQIITLDSLKRLRLATLSTTTTSARALPLSSFLCAPDHIPHRSQNNKAHNNKLYIHRVASNHSQGDVQLHILQKKIMILKFFVKYRINTASPLFRHTLQFLLFPEPIEQNKQKKGRPKPSLSQDES